MRAAGFLLACALAAACGDDTGDDLRADAGAAAPAPSIVARTVPADARCPHGGSLVQSGPDRDGDGILDDDEVATTTPICAAAPSIEPPLLTRLDPVPAGATCPAGGIAFLTGHDRDGDGVLAAAEVEHTDTRCGEVVHGDLAIRSDADVAALASITAITGSLTVDATATVTALRLPALRFVGGRLDVAQAAKLTAVDLPDLVAVGQTSVDDRDDLRVVGNGALTSLRLGVTACGDHRLSIGGNPALVAVEVTCPGARVIALVDNALLATATLDVGHRAGTVRLEDAPALVRVALRARSLLALEIRRTPVLTDLAVTPIESDRADASSVTVEAPITTWPPLAINSDGYLSLRDTRLTALRIEDAELLSLYDNEVLTTVHANAVRNVSLYNNPVLTTADLRARTEPDSGPIDRGAIYIQGNPALVDAPWLADLHRVESLTLAQLAAPLPSTLDLVVTKGVLRLIGVTGVRTLRAQLVDYRIAFVSSTSVETLDVTATGDLTRGVLTAVQSNPALTRASLPPVLQSAGSARVRDNAALVELVLPLPATLASVQIVDNPHLPACRARAILDSTVAQTEEQSGNDEHTLCP